MFRAKRSVATVSVLGVLGVAGVSAAAVTRAPTAEQVEADIVFTHVSGKVRTCAGADGGQWTEAVFTATGTASGTPSLTGDVSARFSVLASEAGGYNHGWLRITEPGTSRTKAHGRFFQSEIEEIDQGVLVGEIRAPRSGGHPLRLVAGIRTLFVPGGTFTAQLGGEVPDGRLPATAIGGGCTGAYEQFQIDVPAPADGGRTARTSGRHFAW